MLKNDFKILNKMGLHARPAALFVKKANTFQCEVFVEKDDENVNGKSIMALMMLAAGYGDTITVQVEGADEEKAMAELGAIINAGFNEL